ncbi:MAG: hypothetical protein MZV70_51525 [Desulfobacterales bacterium]|nr:hypothetical protein [Desulfobacterales bacterium]
MVEQPARPLPSARAGRPSSGAGPRPPVTDCPCAPMSRRSTPRRWETPAFKATHGLRYAYVAGEMANGITSVRMVTGGRQGRHGGVFRRRRPDACRRWRRRSTGCSANCPASPSAST